MLVIYDFISKLIAAILTANSTLWNIMNKKTISDIFLVLAIASHANAAKFGMLAKSVTDENFISAAKSCDDQARLQNDTCDLVGPSGSALPRFQLESLQKILKDNYYVGLAISVTNSNVLSPGMKNVKIPIVTFDSNFDEGDVNSFPYVGPDNYLIGKKLGELVKKNNPNGGKICIVSDNNTNLNQRVIGIRRELSGKTDLKGDRQLNGENGWREVSRCNPLMSEDSPSRTLDLLLKVIENHKPVVIVSTGHWPIVDTELYKKKMAPYISHLQHKKLIMISAVGESKVNNKLDLLNDKLVHGLVSIDFSELGAKTYKILKALHSKQPLSTDEHKEIKIYIFK